MSLVAIVGRPNVGKSTLFNRLVGQRKAIVDATAGTTRDRHYGKTDWNGREFSVIDTGGYTVNSEDIFEDEIRRQVLLAIDEADVILFLVEVKTGITDLDMLMADLLRRTSKKVILVCNKVDNNDQIYSSHEFYALGLGDPYCISSMSGSGTGDLMDAILAALPAEAVAEEEENLPHITIVGRPNVGKSSMTNALLGEERNIVTSIAGTTRDSIHTRYNKFGMDFYLVDTAGMRKKGKAMEDLEFYSVMRSIRAIENSDVCILMLDAQQGLESQDLNIHNLIVRNRKGCVIVVNKWDLVEKDNNTMKEWTEFLKKKLAPFNDIPIIFTSVLSKQRIFDVLQTAIRVYESRKRRISTSALNDFLLPLIENYPRDQRQIHQDQICNPVADADAAVRVLRQSAAVHQGALPPLPRKQHPRPLGFLRCTDADLLPAEIRTGCGIARSRHRRNPASPLPLAQNKKGRHAVSSLFKLRYASRRRANSLRAVSESSTTAPARIAVSFITSRPAPESNGNPYSPLPRSGTQTSGVVTRNDSVPRVIITASTSPARPMRAEKNPRKVRMPIPMISNPNPWEKP